MKVNVELCMGSSCFARGNSRILSFLEQYMAKCEHSDEIEIAGHLCMGNCSGGPVVRINGTDYLNKGEMHMVGIIEDILREQ